MKGSKRDRWLKDGVKESRKHFKKIWNRKVRRYKNDLKNSEYKRLSGVTAYEYVP